MHKFLILVFTVLIAACASNSGFQADWDKYTFDVFGRKFSFSAPKGHFSDIYVSRIDLSEMNKPAVVLFQRAWVFSGLFSDKGGLDFGVNVRRVEASINEE